MYLSCPYCSTRPDYVIDFRTIIRFGVFYRTSDSKSVERFRCKLCKKTFSKATLDPCYHQKKRQKNLKIFEHLASCVSQRRTARLLRINRKTVARRLKFMGLLAQDTLLFERAKKPIKAFQFDDLETHEQSKYHPLSVTIAVEKKTRRILGIKVASMPAKGRLTKKAKLKYGRRKDERRKARRALFSELKPHVEPGALIESDLNPYYEADVKEFFPDCTYQRFEGKRGAITGQGELKKTEFDPLFSLNHTYAMFRANVARLIRKTWCTTKKKERLLDHLMIYAVYHNQHLKTA